MSVVNTVRIKRTCDHLLSWIKVNQVKQQMNEEMMSDCINRILQLFGSNENLLQFLTTYSSKHQLDSIYNILQETIQRFKQNEAEKDNNSTKDQIKILSKKSIPSNNFDNISKESISKICSFLSRDEIINFKIISRRISIICLQEMAKYSVGICNPNNLLHSKYGHTLKWWRYSSLYKFNNNTTYSLIFENLEKHNNFPQKYQIPIAIDKYNKHQNINKYDTIYPKSSLIVFDKRSVSILDSKHVTTKMTENDTFNDNKQSLLTLHYFDVEKQAINIVKYMIIDDSVTINKLDQYIRHTLINEICGMKAIFNTLDTDKQKLVFYPFDSEYNYLSGTDTITTLRCFESQKLISLIFQIDDTSIMSCKSTKDIKMEYEASTLKMFYEKGWYYLEREKYYFDRKKIVIQCETNDLIKLKTQIMHYLKVHQLGKKEEDLIKKIDEKLGDYHYMIVLDTNLNVNVLKRHLSKYLFDGVVSANNIELDEILKERDTRLLKFDYKQTTVVSLEIVPYDTMAITKIEENTKIYTINLLSELQAPFPFNMNQISIKPTIRIRIRMKKKCTVDEIVKELIKISSNPMFSHQFEGIKESFNGYIDSIHPNCYVIMDEFRYIDKSDDEEDDDYYDEDEYYGGAMYEHYQNYKILYESSDIINPPNSISEEVTDLNLFMLPHEINTITTSKTHRLMVRFCLEDGFEINDFQKEWWQKKCLIGFPIFVWIDTNDKIIDILTDNQSLQQYKNDIVSIHSVCSGNVNLITKEEHCRYQLFGDLLHRDSNGFIVITIDKRNDMYVDQYSFSRFGIVIAGRIQ